MPGIRIAAATFLSLALLAASASAQKKYDPGASDSEIKLGQTMPYSGPLSGFITLAKAERSAMRFAKPVSSSPTITRPIRPSP